MANTRGVVWTLALAAVAIPLQVQGAVMLPPTVAEGATLELVHTGEPLYEGPVWHPETACWYFTAARAGEIYRLDEAGAVTVLVENTEGVNGMVLARDNTLLGAQAFGHRLVKIDPTSASSEMVTVAEDMTWNQPNDVCETARGDLYFSDPNWADNSKSAVYRMSPEGEVTRIIDDIATPNGVITSLDGRTLYLGDSRNAVWHSYPIAEDGSIGAGSLFFDPDTENRSDPDGMAIDEHGNLYFTGRGGVWVVSPEGEALGLIPTPEFCANVGLGGPDGQSLLLTCRGKVYRLAMRVRGPR